MRVDISPGQVIKSKAGRDKDKYFVVLEVIDDDYILLSDGDIRKVEKPKKKKIKHVRLTDYVLEEIKQKLIKSEKINNSEIKKYLLKVIEEINHK